MLEVSGDSMTADGIFSGDEVLIRKTPEVEFNGQIAVVIVNGNEGTLKRVYVTDNSITLNASNPNYPPRTFCRHALDWEYDFKNRKQGQPEMSFAALWEEYKEDLRNRIKELTWATKIHIVDKRILPFFKDTPINEIDEKMVRKWQNWILDLKKPSGESYSDTYIKTISNQLSAILNHAVTYYKLPYNPVHRTGSIGQKHAEKMEF